MKKTYLTAVLIILIGGLSVNAQMTNSSDAKKIKEKKIVVAYRPYKKKAEAWEKALTDSLNSRLEYVMKNYWDFNEVTEFMPLSEAKAYIKKNKDACFITIGDGYSTSTSKARGIRYISRSEQVQIFAPGLTASVYLPYYEDYAKTSTVVYGVLQLQKILELLYEEEVKSAVGMLGYVKKNGPKLLKKTLLIPKEFLNAELSEDDIKLAYPFDMEVADYEKIERAIVDKDPKYAVVYYVIIPANGRLFHKIYVSNAEDGDIYGLIDGNKIAIDLGIVTLGTGENKKYLINNKELKNLGKLVD